MYLEATRRRRGSGSRAAGKGKRSRWQEIEFENGAGKNTAKEPRRGTGQGETSEKQRAAGRHCVATYSPPVTNVTLGRSGDPRPLDAASSRSGQLHSSPRKVEARAQQQNSLLEARWNVVVGGNLAMGSCRTRQAAGGQGGLSLAEPYLGLPICTTYSYWCRALGQARDSLLK